MNVEFLDIGLPVESDNSENARETMRKLREYCKRLGKAYGELTEAEIELFRNEAS